VTTLAALARETQTVKLGQLVTGNGYRNPALLAKMASTLDVISNGRLKFGIGAGWYEEEYRAFGYEYLSAPGRLRQLDEALQIITSMWTEQKPHIPVMIAGGGEKVTLKLVAKYGDLCNVQEPPHVVARKFGVLAKHCTDVGREFSEITKTSTSYCIIADSDEEARAAVPPWAPMVFPGTLADYGLVGTLDTIGKRLAVYEEAGVDELIVGFADALNPETLRTFASAFIQK
jgi:alkanesulfonate monooxygenase SsuD/methylene tetrahydromethanopterin reductase-like flavin-dependent oxidoreductase (luciferase family)